MSGYTVTPNYNLRKPVVGADNDLWGGDWNLNADTIDTQMKANANSVASVQSSYVPIAGGVAMTGLLTLSGAPTSNLHGATKLYADQGDATRLPLAGGTATGPVYAPTLGMDANNVWTGTSLEPGYIWSIRDGSGNIAVALDWSGLLWIAGIGAPTAGNQPVSLSYLQAALTSYLPLTGGNLSGPLGLIGNSTINNSLEPGLAWSIRDGNGNVALGLAYDGTLWVAKMQLLSGGTTPNPPFVLPTTPGASGTWWNNGSFICVVP